MSPFIKSSPVSLLGSKEAEMPKISPEAQNPGLRKLCLSSNHWFSRIDSSVTEIKLLKNIIERYLTSCAADSSIDRIQSLNKQLSWLSMHEDELIGKIAKHQRYLQILLKKSKIKSEEVGSYAHSKLEKEINDYIKALKNIKTSFISLRRPMAEIEKASTWNCAIPESAEKIQRYS